jgi:hypothetical protein
VRVGERKRFKEEEKNNKGSLEMRRDGEFARKSPAGMERERARVRDCAFKVAAEVAVSKQPCLGEHNIALSH